MGSIILKLWPFIFITFQKFVYFWVQVSLFDPVQIWEPDRHIPGPICRVKLNEPFQMFEWMLVLVSVRWIDQKYCLKEPNHIERWSWSRGWRWTWGWSRASCLIELVSEWEVLLKSSVRPDVGFCRWASTGVNERSHSSFCWFLNNIYLKCHCFHGIVHTMQMMYLLCRIKQRRQRNVRFSLVRRIGISLYSMIEFPQSSSYRNLECSFFKFQNGVLNVLQYLLCGVLSDCVNGGFSKNISVSWAFVFAVIERKGWSKIEK